jgi:uncharacterized protein YceK
MKLPLSVLISLVLLSGCGTEVSSSSGLTVIEYSKPLQTKAANEIEGGQCRTLGEVFMPDYSVLRDQARVR